MGSFKLLVYPEFMKYAADLPKDLKSKLIKCMQLLCGNYNHPSLQCKRIKSAKETVFECRVDQDVRLIYDVQGNNLRIWYVGRHDEALKYAQKKPVYVDDIEIIENTTMMDKLSLFLDCGDGDIDYEHNIIGIDEFIKQIS